MPSYSAARNTPLKLIAVLYKRMDNGGIVINQEVTEFLKHRLSKHEFMSSDFWKSFCKLRNKPETIIHPYPTGQRNAEIVFKYEKKSQLGVSIKFQIGLKTIKNYAGKFFEKENLTQLTGLSKYFFEIDLNDEMIYNEEIAKYSAKFHAASVTENISLNTKQDQDNNISTIDHLYLKIIEFFNQPIFNQIEIFIDDDGFVINLMPSIILKLVNGGKIKIWYVKKEGGLSERINLLALYGCEVNTVKADQYFSLFKETASRDIKNLKNKSSIFFIAQKTGGVAPVYEYIKAISFYTNIFKSGGPFIGKVYDPYESSGVNPELVRTSILGNHTLYRQFFHSLSLQVQTLKPSNDYFLREIDGESHLNKFVNDFKEKYETYLAFKEMKLGSNIKIGFKEVDISVIRPRTRHFTKFKLEQNKHIIAMQRQYNEKHNHNIETDCFTFFPIQIYIGNNQSFYLNPPILEYNPGNGKYEIGEGHHRLRNIYDERLEYNIKSVKALVVENIDLTSARPGVTHYEWDSEPAWSHGHNNIETDGLVRGRYYEKATHTIKQEHKDNLTISSSPHLQPAYSDQIVS